MKVLRIIEHQDTLVLKWDNFLKSVKSKESPRNIDLHCITGNNKSDKHTFLIRNITHVSIEHTIKCNHVWLTGAIREEGLFNLHLLLCLRAIEDDNRTDYLENSKKLETQGLRISVPANKFNQDEYANY
jgi:hypothetical protein